MHQLAKKCAFVLFLLVSSAALAKESSVVVVWPSEQNPVVRFTFGKFVKTGNFGNQQAFTTEVTAENLWSKPIPSASFEAYFFDKDRVRVGSGYINLNNVGVKETVKQTMPFNATGAQPVNFKIVPIHVPKELGPAGPPKKVRMTVYSVPAGANLKVDGEPAGVTPKQVELTVGKHTITFSREGYHDGSFPVEVGPDDVSGGTVSFELGGLAHDTVEMRDGTTLVGDIDAMDARTIEIRVAGNSQSIERNRVKRILLVEREAPTTQLAPR